MKFQRQTILRPASATELAFRRHLLSMLGVSARIGEVSLSKPEKQAPDRYQLEVRSVWKFSGAAAADEVK